MFWARMRIDSQAVTIAGAIGAFLSTPNIRPTIGPPTEARL